MKKRIILVTLSAMISLFYVAPVWGQSEKKYKNNGHVICEAAYSISNVAIASNISFVASEFISKSFSNMTKEEGWLSSNANIRELPNLDSNIIDVWNYGEKISYYQINDNNWCAVIHDNNVAYIHKSLISETEIVPINYVEYEVPNNTIKSYMSYKKITYKYGNEYKLQEIAYTGNYGVRQVDDRYCIAVGSAYTKEVGTYIDLVLENGTVIPCILGDCKDDKDTDSSHRITYDGSLAEFIVDDKQISRSVKKMGSLNYACDEWNSKISKIRIYDNNAET